jgi:hypothetical protein
MHGLFYELSPLGWAGSTWGVRPISQHLRMIPDFASYRGFLVLGGNQVGWPVVAQRCQRSGLFVYFWFFNHILTGVDVSAGIPHL